MGNAQCTSIHNSKFTFESLEHKLKKGESPLEKSILREYTEIKQGLYFKKINEKSNSDIDECLSSIKYKSITSYTDIERKKNCFINWIQIMTSNLISNNNTNNQISFQKIIEEKLNNFYNEKNKKFVDLVALGPPKSIRSILWMICANIPANRNCKLFEELLSEDIDKKSEEQIKKDLNRTYFQNETYTEEQLKKLYNLLKVFALHDREIGYCQGMNFIVKFILRVTDYNEVDSFYLISYLFGQIRGYFTDDFPLLKVNVYIFTNFFKKLFPKLYDHFKLMEIPDELWIGKWMQTLFTICLPYEITCRIWDSLFAYGLDFVIPLSLSFLKSMEADLLKFLDSSDVIEFFKETLFPQQTKKIYKDQEDYTISIDKIISYAKHLYKTMNKEAIYNIKKEYETKFNTNLELLTKKYDMTLLKYTKTFSSSQSSTDFSLSKNENGNQKEANNNMHITENNKQIFSSASKPSNIQYNDIIDEEICNCDECGSDEEMNTTNLHLHVFDTKNLSIYPPLKSRKDNND